MLSPGKGWVISFYLFLRYINIFWTIIRPAGWAAGAAGVMAAARSEKRAYHGILSFLACGSSRKNMDYE
jgi:hypothetical protein